MNAYAGRMGGEDLKVCASKLVRDLRVACCKSAANWNGINKETAPFIQARLIAHAGNHEPLATILARRPNGSPKE